MNLQENAKIVKELHLRDLLQDRTRAEQMHAETDGIIFDYSHQLATTDTVSLLLKYAEQESVPSQIQQFFAGEKINPTEQRSVMHHALRRPKGASPQLTVDGQDVDADVHAVLDKIRDFSEAVRSGSHVGCTGKPLRNIVSIGIGGSYLGPEFVYEALRFDKECQTASAERRLRFLANVDPVDVARALEGLQPETTLVIIVSKTFTTAETMLNARTVRTWLTKALGAGAVAKHMVAVSTNEKGVTEFGIDRNNMFEFWDWVGGRFSVCSAVGMLSLSTHFGFDLMRKFLDGAHNIDNHFRDTPMEKNIPVLMALFDLWNANFLGHCAHAVLPYSQALCKFASHIQQVSMESNGKRVTKNGETLSVEAGEIVFGEPGTNGQHSFYQLMHQGRTIPADFIGFCKSQSPVHGDGEVVSNHDELMSNFFAQADALACGKTADDLAKEGVPAHLVSHKVFPGNRPSSSLLLNNLTPYTCGQLLALYEHRTAALGFLWNINSFDQWGVELGKVLAKRVRQELHESRQAKAPRFDHHNPATTRLLQRYLQHSE